MHASSMYPRKNVLHEHGSKHGDIYANLLTGKDEKHL
jgi:hypothetical protein